MIPENRNVKWIYEDIVDLPHPVSATHPRMDAGSRAAQFSPFAALSGYEDAVWEEERLTEREVELSEDKIEEINGKLALLNERIDEHPMITLSYFVPDEKKSGGQYVTITGVVKQIDTFGQRIVMQDKTQVPMKNIMGCSIND